MATSERCSSWGVITAWRMGWTKLESHCEPNPAPPAPTSLVSHLLFCKSSAIVIRPGVPPRCVRRVFIVKVDSAAIVLGPAVELPQIEVTRPKMIVNDVED